jgi:type II secretory pathway pseudopilin PulG
MNESENISKPSANNTNQIGNNINVVPPPINPPHTPTHCINGDTKENPPLDKFARIVAIVAILIAGAAAGFTYWQATIAKDTAQKQLRAYLGFNLMGTQFIQSKNPNPIFQGFIYSLVDYGQTPATVIEIGGKIKTLQFPLREDFIPEYPVTDNFNQSFIVFPGKDSCKGILPPESSSILNEIQQTRNNNNIRVYLFARVIYLDCFNIKHSTCVCMFIDPVSIDNRQDGTFAARCGFYSRYNTFD